MADTDTTKALRSIKSKDVRKMLKALVADGFTLKVGGSGHVRIIPPAAVLAAHPDAPSAITCAVSPSDGARAVRNIKGDLRRRWEVEA